MKPPKCRLCEHEHWGDSHIWADTAKHTQAAGYRTRNQPVTTDRNPNVTIPVTCNHCVTKDAEIARLKSELAALTPVKPKRDRAKYMRDYRRGKHAPDTRCD